MGWTLLEDGVQGHVGGELGFQGTMVLKRTEHGTSGILVMTNVNLSLLEEDRKLEWFENYYFEIEQLLMHTADEILIQEAEVN